MKSAAATLLLSGFLVGGIHAEESPPAAKVGQAGGARAIDPERGFVGMSFKEQNGQVLVDKIYAATPASRQTVVQPGDRLVSIARGGESPVVLTGNTADQVKALLQGGIGSEIRIAAARPGEDDSKAREVTMILAAWPETAFLPGDPAPRWQTGVWVQGEPVKAFEPDKVYLIECWATWCRPCVASIPHLNDLHLKYRDQGLVVIGQNICQKDEALVRQFVASKGEKMSYRVAMDEIPATTPDNMVSGLMANDWIPADKLAGYGPHVAFLVGKDGKIAWSGTPEDLPEATIEAALAAPASVPEATPLPAPR